MCPGRVHHSVYCLGAAVFTRPSQNVFQKVLSIPTGAGCAPWPHTLEQIGTLTRLAAQDASISLPGSFVGFPRSLLDR